MQTRHCSISDAKPHLLRHPLDDTAIFTGGICGYVQFSKGRPAGDPVPYAVVAPLIRPRYVR